VLTFIGRRILHCTVISRREIAHSSPLVRVCPHFWNRIGDAYQRFIFRYAHVEAEFPFVTFEELMERIEDLVCDVTDRVLQFPESKQLLHEINPVLILFIVPTGTYIKWCTYNARKSNRNEATTNIPPV
jgi:hypothetical protein